MENKNNRFKINKNSESNESNKSKSNEYKNSDERLNTDVDDYTTDELLNLFKLEANPSLFQITTLANSAITRLKTSEDYDKNILYFLEDARDKLLTIFSNGNFISIGDLNANQRGRESNQIKTRNNDLKYENIDKISNERDERGNEINKDKKSDFNEWYTNEYLPPRDSIMASKLTNRVQQAEPWNANESHYPMKQNLLGINQSIQIPVSQDTLNPTLRNLNTRIVNLDSQFRQNILPFYPYDPDALTSSTHYTCELSDTLTKVLSILLYSVQIPNTWYRFSHEQGNTCFKLEYNSNTYYFNLPSGNYDPSSIVVALNNNSNWNPSPRPSGLVWDYNPTTSKISFTTGNLSDTIFYFYDDSGSGSFQCQGGSKCYENMEINKNLGWYLGFRPVMYTNSDKQFLTFIKSYSANSTNVVDATIDLTGTKYFSIILDDFNKNRQNKGLVNIALVENTKLNLPNYYSSDLKIDCSGNKIEVSSGKYKKITQAQSYSINQILQNRKNKLQKSGRLISSDILAILPIDINLNTRTQPYTVFGVNMLLNERRYYGPVNINKFKIRLVDDRGLTVNLNGSDWTMSLLVNELYQY
jgi:hypothetical protein